MKIIIKTMETKEGVRFRIKEDGAYKFLHLPFNNYFYIKTVDYEESNEEFLKQFKNVILKIDTTGSFTKIVMNNNFMRRRLRDFWEERCKTYEADIMTNKRFLLDTKITLNNEYIPFLFFDIETDDRLPLQKDERGFVVVNKDARILSFSAIDQNGSKFSIKLAEDNDESEIKFLAKIMDIFSDYGIITGWFSERFDMPYIKQRCDILGVNYMITDYLNHLDYMELYKKYSKKTLKSYSLNSVAEFELNEKKIEQEKGNGAIYNTWKNDSDKLLRYNLEDANLIKKLNDKLMFMEVSMKRANNAGCHVRSTMWNSDSGDFLLLKGYKKDGIIMPSKPTKEEIIERQLQGKIGGGWTTCLKPGFHEDVDVWDYKSMYPEVIKSWNISPETYVETIKNEKDALNVDKDYIVTPPDMNEEQGFPVYHPSRIYKRKKGVVPKICTYLTEERDKIKYSMNQYKKSDPDKYKQMYLEQYALKTDANSIYGILAFPPGRYYLWEVGDTVTTCCRAMIKSCYKKAEEWGCTVIGGDTDSTFLLLNDNSKESINKNFVDFFNKWMQNWRVYIHSIEFEWEYHMDTMLFAKKKNYAYKSGDEIVIKGMECIKSDSNIVAAQYQKEFIYDVLKKEYKEEEWRSKLNIIINRVFNQKLTSVELLLTKALTKMPKDYEGYIIDRKTGESKIKLDGTLQKKSIPAHVNLASRLIDKGIDIYPGTKIKYIVIKDKPILALSQEEYDKGQGIYKTKSKKFGEIDYEFTGLYDAKYYYKRIAKPLIKVLFAYHRKLPDWDFNLTDSEINKIIGED